MLSDAIQKGINEQIKHEFASAYAYLGMAAHFESSNFVGFAQWTRAQFQEEMGHGLRLFDFIHRRGGKATLHAIPQPNTKFDTPLNVFETALKQEREVTELIHNLYELAQKEKDYGTQVELQWFISEQIEEEDTFEQIVQHLKLAGDDRAALLLLDQKLADRGGGGAKGQGGE